MTTPTLHNPETVPRYRSLTSEQLACLPPGAGKDFIPRAVAVEVSVALKDYANNSHDCGCTDGSFIYGCRHIRRALIDAIPQLDAALGGKS